MIDNLTILVDCKWNQWQPYGTCSQTCGGGYKKRTRTVLEYQRYGGKPCRSSDGESQTSCNTHDCDSKSLYICITLFLVENHQYQ